MNSPDSTDVQLSGLVTGERVTLADVLPCEWCGWMRLPDGWDCTCGRPELRAAVVRPWVHGHRASTTWVPAA